MRCWFCGRGRLRRRGVFHREERTERPQKFLGVESESGGRFVFGFRALDAVWSASGWLSLVPEDVAGEHSTMSDAVMIRLSQREAEYIRKLVSEDSSFRDSFLGRPDFRDGRWALILERGEADVNLLRPEIGENWVR